MEILLTGTIYSGKTTLIESLEGIAGIATIPELAKEIIRKDPKIESRPEFQDILFEKQVKRETMAMEKNQIIVCDRGILDIIVHSRYYGHLIKKDWVNWLPTYGLIFLVNKEDVPFNVSTYPPGVNWNQFREDLHRITLETLMFYGLSYTLLSGSIEQRKNFLLEEISKKQ